MRHWRRVVGKVMAQLTRSAPAPVSSCFPGFPSPPQASIGPAHLAAPPPLPPSFF